MNSTTSKRHVETLRNRNIPFQLKKLNTCRNGIENLGPYSTSLSSLEPLSFPVYKHYHREINSVGVGPAIRAFT